MSVYLNGSSVLLDSGSVATDAACCCCQPCCPDGNYFLAFDGSGRKFLTATYTYQDFPPECNDCITETDDIFCQRTHSYDPDTCELTIGPISCSGSFTCCPPDPPDCDPTTCADFCIG